MALTITIDDQREKEICEYAQMLEDKIERRNKAFLEVTTDGYESLTKKSDVERAMHNLLEAVNESTGFAQALLRIGIYTYHSGVNADGPMKLYKA